MARYLGLVELLVVFISIMMTSSVLYWLGYDETALSMYIRRV